ncbi:MAG: hypothetical protein ACP5P0_04650, partial [Hydrogenobacter sp.]
MSLKSYRTIRTLLGEFSLLDVVSITVFFGALPEVLFSLIDFFLQGEGNSLKRAGLLALITAVALAYISVRYKKLKEFFEERDLRSKAKLEKVVVIPSEQSKNYYKHFEEMVNELFGGLSVEQFGPANY